MGAAVQFRLLGSLEVLNDGRPIGLGRTKQRALLARLLLTPNQVVASDALIDVLWGDSPPASATASLHVLVSNLRRSLGSELVVTRRPGYLLSVDPDSIDAVRFEAAVASARSARARGDLDVARRELQTGLEQWRGDVLADLSDEPFVEGEATRLRELRLAALEDRCEVELALGQHNALVAELEPMVEQHPYRENLRRLLMLALYRSGRQADALRVYQTGRTALVEQLGVDPGRALQQLERDIIAQDPALDWTPAPPPATTSATASGTASPTSASSPAVAPAPPFVGRVADLAALLDAVESSRTGEGALLLVSGEPGIGKTRLAEELAGRAATGGSQVLWGRCYEGQGAPPFWPWVQALRALGGVSSTGTQLTDLLPETSDAPEVRVRLFEAVADKLRSAAAERHVLVILDDLHAADTPSLALLRFVATELAGMGVLVVGLYRGTDARPGTPIADAIARLVTESVVSRRELSGFTPPELARFLDTLGYTRTEAETADLLERTDGNPFFAREVVRFLDSSEASDRAIPPSVRDVVRSRLAQLSSGTAEWLQTASVMGRDIDVAVLEHLDSGVDSEEPLEEAAAAGVLTTDVVDPTRARFVHAVVQESLYDQLATVRRARLHGRVAEAIERMGEVATSRRLSEIANHYFQSSRAGRHHDQAVRYAVRAAEQATGGLAYEEAVRQYERALEVIAGGPPAAIDRRGELLIALADARWRAGDVPGAREVCLEAAKIAREAGDTPLLAAAVIGWGGGEFRSWHAARGDVSAVIIDHLEVALDQLEPGDSTTRVQLLGALAEQLYYAGDGRRVELSAEAVAMARRLGEPRTLASALSSRVLAIWDPDHVRERHDEANEIVELADRLGWAELAVFGRCQTFIALAELARVDEAAAVHDELTRMANELRQPVYEWEARRLSVVLPLYRGDFDAAERLASEALELGVATGDPDVLSIFGTQLALIRTEQDRLAEVAPAIVDFSEEFADIPAWEAGVALMLAELGRTAEANAKLDVLATPEWLDGLTVDFVWLATIVMLVEATALLGRTDAAERLYARLLPYQDQLVFTGDRAGWGPASRSLGLLATVLGRLDDAERHFAVASSVADATRGHAWRANTYFDWSVARALAGDQDRAEELRAKAITIAEELGMARLLRRARG